MNYLHRLELWGNNHHPKWFDYIRIALGAFLCFKAVSFLVDMSYLVSIMRAVINKDMSAFMVVFFGQFIVIVTLLCGIFIIFGIHTRLMCIIQIPIIIGAIILLNKGGGGGASNTAELLFTVLTLILLVAFLVIGNGPLSYSKMFQEEDKAYRDTH